MQPLQSFISGEQPGLNYFLRGSVVRHCRYRSR